MTDQTKAFSITMEETDTSLFAFLSKKTSLPLCVNPPFRASPSPGCAGEGRGKNVAPPWPRQHSKPNLPQWTLYPFPAEIQTGTGWSERSRHSQTGPERKWVRAASGWGGFNRAVARLRGRRKQRKSWAGRAGPGNCFCVMWGHVAGHGCIREPSPGVLVTWERRWFEIFYENCQGWPFLKVSTHEEEAVFILWSDPLSWEGEAGLETCKNPSSCFNEWLRQRQEPNDASTEQTHYCKIIIQWIFRTCWHLVRDTWGLRWAAAPPTGVELA